MDNDGGIFDEIPLHGAGRILISHRYILIIICVDVVHGILKDTIANNERRTTTKYQWWKMVLKSGMRVRERNKESERGRKNNSDRHRETTLLCSMCLCMKS